MTKMSLESLKTLFSLLKMLKILTWISIHLAQLMKADGHPKPGSARDFFHKDFFLCSLSLVCSCGTVGFPNARYHLSQQGCVSILNVENERLNTCT